MRRSVAFSAGLIVLAATCVAAQSRNTKVHNDRKKFQDRDFWIYNDLPKGIAEAKKTRKPLLIVFR